MTGLNKFRYSKFAIDTHVLLMVACLFAGYMSLNGRATAASEESSGQWQTLPYPMPINPIHAFLLQNDRVLVVAGSENDPAQKRTRAALWDSATGTVAVRDIWWDSFCSGISATPDGRRLITGGTAAYPVNGGVFLGLKNTAIYDPDVSGSFVVNGSGTGLGAALDGFHYKYLSLSGDGTITAQLTGMSNTTRPFVNDWAKSGVMIRESLAPNSSHAFIGLTARKGFGFQRRLTTGGTGPSNHLYSITGAAMAQNWLRLSRSGNRFSAFTSPDGIAWTRVGTATIVMGSPTVYIGLAVTAHYQSPNPHLITNTSTFNNVSVVPTMTEGWKDLDIGSVAASGGAFSAGDFTAGPEMSGGRWYPTNTALPDGSTVTVSGQGTDGLLNRSNGVLDPTTTAWTDSLPHPSGAYDLYPWGHLLPNTAGALSGHVFYSGSGSYTRVLDVNPASPNYLKYTIVARSIDRAGHAYGSSVLLPLRPENNYKPEVMIMGGRSPAVRTVERIDLSRPTIAWQPAAPMAYARVQLTATLLPTAKVLVTGGSAVDEVASTAVKAAEQYDPVTNTWSTLASASYARMYHAVTLLLPDATVWTAGSQPGRGFEPKMEIFRPPYLFMTDTTGQTIPAPRPAITSAPMTIGYGVPFNVETSSATNIQSAVLIRPGASTHAFDMEQRLVGLRFDVVSGHLAIQGPSDSNLAPPGYYMLFLVNRQGVPSIARFVQLIS